VLNASYLVPHSRGDDFAAAVAELADEYPVLQLELTGPWPPYSFIEPDRPAGSPEAGP
jgi:Gas vesicle synthesis protein GvpL/GvpF